MILEPVTLEGQVVRLEPLGYSHVDGLCAVGLDPGIWTLTTANPGNAEGMRAYVQSALEMRATGNALPFATIEQATGRPVGCTRFANASIPDKRVEIGWTWIAPPWQRTAVNTEAKLLMLRHAFEVWKFNRVEFKTDALNRKSRAALARIGAVEEGTLRKHMIMTPGGRVRDSVYFSVLDTEWPAVRQRLTQMLAPRG